MSFAITSIVMNQAPQKWGAKASVNFEFESAFFFFEFGPQGKMEATRAEHLFWHSLFLNLWVTLEVRFHCYTLKKVESRREPARGQ